MVTALYPFVGRRLDLDGIGLHYVDEGDGPPVLLLHGNPTWSFFYRNLITALRSTNRAIAPDHVGCGRSDKPTTDRYPYTLARRIDDLSKLIDTVVPEGRVSLVVHDWGGMIGMAWATRHPERVDRIVAMNTAAFRLPKGKQLPWSLRLGRNCILGPPLIRGLNLFCRGAAKHCVVRQPLSEDVREQFLAPYGSWADRIAVDRFVRTIPLTPSDDGYNIVAETEIGLSRVADHRIMLAWGMKDFVFDGDYLAEWRQRFPKAEVCAVTDAGHYLLEDAGDELIPRIVQFLKP
jgi:cis-3-alkyl-4-acyloxetan-2-one decarboxylase